MIRQHTIELFFDDTIDQDIVNLISTQEINNKYQLKVEQLKPPPPNTGGDMWSGTALFISGAIAGGFLGELGKDIYIYLKEKFLRIKKELTLPNTLLTIIREEGYILIFDMQNIQTHQELNIALSEIIKIINEVQKLPRENFNALNFLTENEIAHLDENTKLFLKNSYTTLIRDYQYNSMSKKWEIKNTPIT